MNDDSQIKSNGQLTTAAILGPIVLLFLPLGLSLVEHFTLGTHEVEQLCQRLGIHETLSQVYGAAARLCGLHL